MKTKVIIMAVLVALACRAAGGLFLHFYSEDGLFATNWWMRMNALAWSLVTVSFAWYANGLLREVLATSFIIMLGELIDELYFDPTRWGWNELIVLNLAALYLLYHAKKYVRPNR